MTIKVMCLVELKRPQRDDLRGDNKNPISQVLRYVSDIKSGKVKKANGRSFGQVENAAFYCYVIADITDKNNNNSILTIFKKLRVKGSVLDRFGEFLKGDKDKFYFDFFYMAESKDKENIEIIKEELGNYGLLLLIDYQARRNS